MNKPRKNKRVRVGISIGDPNGIGLEVALKSFNDNRIFDHCTPVFYASAKLLSFAKKNLNVGEFVYNQIDDANDAVSTKINVVNCFDEFKIELGTATAEGGKIALASLEAATKDLAENKIDVLVTAPINKKNIQSPNFKFPGHTEYLANYANEKNYLMIMVHDKIKVGLVTGHIPLKEVSEQLTTERIIEKAEVFYKSLVQDFKYTKPKLAILGLNPHSGDSGLLGSEEQEIIAPAIEKLQQKGMYVFGPYPSDGFFGSSAITKFDGVLAMYHDQGLAPFKALAFDEGVNYTAGLPIVRTSPDHGVAYDIAGQGIANPDSFRNAVYLACDVYNNQREFKELSANPLQKLSKTKLDINS